MPVAQIPEPTEGFSRRLIDRDYSIMVDSICDYCGFRVVGSLTQTLCQEEVEHRLNCLAAPTLSQDAIGLACTK
jgi:hypothetical protein